MDNVELRSLLELAREYGVLSIKYKDVEVHLGPKVEIPMASGLVQVMPNKAEIADEDMLYWSVSEPSKAEEPK